MVVVTRGRPTFADPIGMPDFQALYSKYGELSKSSRFLVMFNPPGAVLKYPNNTGTTYPARDLTFLCESAEIPGRGFMSSDLRYYGPSFKIPYQTTYEDINLTFLIRDRFSERMFFDNWMETINPSNKYDFAYRKDYIGEIHIFQMSDINIKDPTSLDPDAGTGLDIGQQRYVITLQQAYPVLVNPQPMTWADDNFHRLTVTFTYVRWVRAGIDAQPDLNGKDYKLVNDGSTIITPNGTKLPNVLIPR